MASRRLNRSVFVRRWLAVGVLALVALLYYRPLKAYVDAKGQLTERSATVHKLELQKQQLQRQLGSSTSLSTLAREARALGYVRPGERLFIVKGINDWRKRTKRSLAPRR